MSEYPAVIPMIAYENGPAAMAGATILSAPEEASESQPYRAEDLEGHRWMFMQR
jgi:hypothetical protein